MAKALMAALLAVAFAGCAFATGYDDFSRGVTANNRDEFDAAIAAFTSALSDATLAPAYVRAAYRGRGRAYYSKEMWKEALADFEAAMAHDGPKAPNLISRAFAKLKLKDAAGAQQDFLEAIGKDATAATYWDLARIEWENGYDAEAQANLKTAAERIKGDSLANTYIVLWYAFVSDRAGTLDTAELATRAAAIKNKDWPVPVLKLFLGKMTPEQVADEAESWRQDREIRRMCEANFFVAEWQLARKNRDAAIPMLVAAAKNCPRNFLARKSARTELKRLAPESLPVEEDD